MPSTKTLAINSKYTLTHKVSLAVQLTACMTFSGTAHAAGSCPLTPTDRGYVKWNPGHYLMVGQQKVPYHNINNTEKGQGILSLYKDIPAVKGIQKDYFWSELEPTAGTYDFKAIDQDIAALAKGGKKLAIVVAYKYSAGPNRSSLPGYIRNLPSAKVKPSPSATPVAVPAYYNQGKEGDGHSNEGHIANFGHPATLKKFNSLLDAVSAKYDDNPNVVSVSFEESASGVTMSAGQNDIFYDGLLAMNRHAACAFKHTPVIQNLNWPRSILPEFTSNMKQYGLGFGGPDTFFGALETPDVGIGYVSKSKSQSSGVYHYYADMAKTVPIGQQAHFNNLRYPTLESMRPWPGKPHGLPAATAIDKVYDFALAELKPNFMYWHAFDNAPLDYATALRNHLKSSAPLRNECPPVYGNKCNANIGTAKKK